MPYKITKIKGGYRVKNIRTGKITAKRTTKKKALAQVRFLNKIDKN